MAKTIPTVETTDPEAFSTASGEDRNWLRKRFRWQAEWLAKDLPTGAVIAGFRARAKSSQIRATVFLVLLFMTVVLGLFWFIGLPLWQDYQRGLLNAESVRAEADLTARENALQERITALRGLAADRVPATWAAQSSGVDGDLVGVAFADARTGWAVGDIGTILSTADGGATWAAQSSGVDGNLVGVAFADARTGWAVGWGGTILTASSRFSDAIRRTTDAAQLQQALNLTNGNPGINLNAELTEIAELITLEITLAVERSRLRPSGTAASGQAAALSAAVKLAEDTSEQDLDDALRILAAAPDLASSNGRVWWAQYADQVPAGVLLLFLLATLGSLYRYNTRIAGFYHARADALELMALETPPDQERFEALAGTLAADRVEFKAAKTPADMATEITKEVIAKLNLKPGA